MNCPCCGSDMGDKTIPADALDQVRMSPQLRVILRRLVRHHPRAVPRAIIVNDLWSDRRDGGPEGWEKSLHVQLMRLRRTLKPVGYTVTTISGGRDAPGEYLLERVNVA